MNKYEEMKNRQQQEYNKATEGNLIVAFTESQVYEEMAKIGLNPTERDQLTEIGFGGYIRNSFVDEYNAMFERFDKELKEAMAADETGDGFLHDMFLYEFENPHTFTESVNDILALFGFKSEDLKTDNRLQKAFDGAYFEYLKQRR